MNQNRGSSHQKCEKIRLREEWKRHDANGFESQAATRAEYYRRKEEKTMQKAARRTPTLGGRRRKTQTSTQVETLQSSSGAASSYNHAVLEVPGGTTNGNSGAAAQSPPDRTQEIGESSRSASAVTALPVVELPRGSNRTARTEAEQIIQRARAKILSLNYSKVFIEFCCEEDSLLGEHDADDCLAIRVTKDVDATAVETNVTIHSIPRLVAQLRLETHLWISIPCTPGCT